MNFSHSSSSSSYCRLTQSNYLHRIPRIPPYQTTPFTIDPSARSTQTFAQRYGVTPPHSPIDDPYGTNDFNGIEKDVSGGGKTTVIKDTTTPADGDPLNSKRFLPNSSAFDVELIAVCNFSFYLLISIKWHIFCIWWWLIHVRWNVPFRL